MLVAFEREEISLFVATRRLRLGTTALGLPSPLIGPCLVLPPPNSGMSENDLVLL